MRNEGMFLIAFVVLAIVLVVMLSRAGREGFEPESDPVVRITKLEEDVSLLDDRTTAVEDKLSKQESDIQQAQQSVDNAATDIQMINA